MKEHFKLDSLDVCTTVIEKMKQERLCYFLYSTVLLESPEDIYSYSYSCNDTYLVLVLTLFLSNQSK